MEPWTHDMRLGRSSALRRHRYADRFSVVRVRTDAALAEPVHKSSAVSAVLVSVFLKPAPRGAYRLWVDGREADVLAVPAFATNVVGLTDEPAMWGGRGIDHVHLHVRCDARVRPAIAADDPVLAEIARRAMTTPAEPLALDHVELTLAAHLAQRYGDAPPARPARGLAAWQRRRVIELLTGAPTLRLGDLARACDLSVSHFARSFKASFGTTCHRWQTEHRIARARELLASPTIPLADIAIRAGFADQATFTRAFHRVVGMPPGRWRRSR